LSPHPHFSIFPNALHLLFFSRYPDVIFFIIVHGLSFSSGGGSGFPLAPPPPCSLMGCLLFQAVSTNPNSCLSHFGCSLILPLFSAVLCYFPLRFTGLPPASPVQVYIILYPPLYRRFPLPRHGMSNSSVLPMGKTPPPFGPRSRTRLFASILFLLRRATSIPVFFFCSTTGSSPSLIVHLGRVFRRFTIALFLSFFAVFEGL